jgi:hypothetical protein
MISTFLLLGAMLLETRCGAALVQAWQQRYPSGQGAKIMFASDGTLIVAGYADMGMNGFDRLVLKYSASGVGLWTNRWSGLKWASSAYFEPNVAVDTNGNLYVADASYSYPGAEDFQTVAYRGDGTPFWTNRYNGPAGLNDEPTAIAVSPLGELVVTGSSQRDSQVSSLDAVTIAYSSTGIGLWTNRYDSGFNAMLQNFADIPYAVAIDGNGTVFVAGASGYAGPPVYFTIAYSSQGVPLWTNQMSAQSPSFPALLLLDGAGNLYVAGTHWEGGDAYIVTSYANNGATRWVRRCGGYLCYAVPHGMCLDSQTNVFLVCSAFDAFRTFAYTSTGGLLWQRDFSVPVRMSEDSPCAIAAGPDGKVYVAASVTDDGTNYDYLTLAYAINGDLLWTNRYNSGVNGDDRAQSVAVDAGGGIYVTGGSKAGSSYVYDALTFKLVVAPAIQFSKAELMPGGNCRLTIIAPSNTSYRLEGSTNLTDWQPLTNFPPLPVSGIQYTDPERPASRFYRTRWVP